VAAFVEGHHDASVGATAKHFPGHGGTAVDSHIDLPRIDHDAAALRRGDLIPFAAAVRAGVDCLMISHVWYPRFDREVTPATISPNVVRFAREELAYDGVVVTDCMEMGAIKTRMTTREAIPRAILAGCDLTIVSHRPDRQREAVEALAEAVRDGLLPAERLREANRRLDALRRRVRPGAAAIEPGAGPRLAEEIAHRAVTLLRDEERFLPLRPAVGESIGLVTFPLGAASQVEETHVPDPPLAEAIRRRRLSVVGVPAGPDAEIDPILSKLAAVNTVLVGTAFTAGHAYQAAVVKALLQAGKRVVVVALRDPFDLLSFPEAPCYLATYDETPLSADVAVAVILGEREPRGHLPVTLPGCYPRGHGLRTTV
jgi:beta-N-acetylhexosaminidase